MNETIRTFGYPDTLIKEFDNWVVLLRPQQITVGTLVLAAKSDARHLGELKDDIWAEFAEVSSFAEDLLRTEFGAEKFNYLALMMKDPNIHFHFIPRYSQPVNIMGRQFSDPDWPLKTEFVAMELSSPELEEIKSRLTHE
jgi:diadenosine tetraphosphate (Ap4A) HIT family hydrolase